MDAQAVLRGSEMIYLKYLKSLLLHKWYVLLAGLKTGVPLWRLIVHDWQKFTAWEFRAYAQNFFSDYEFRNNETLDAFARYGVAELAPFGHFVDERFALAWLHHENTAPHHWGFWIPRSGKYLKPLPMPETYVREMVADWMGASRAYTGSWNMAQWLFINGPKIEGNMHEKTIALVHDVLIELGYVFTDNAPWICMWAVPQKPGRGIRE